MAALKTIIIVVQVILSLVLIAIVLFQQGNQRGLSGSIAGGAETFFGKNKGRSIDAKLKKWTAIIAVLFLASSICLNLVMQKDSAIKEKAAQEAAAKVQAEQQEAAEKAAKEAPAEEAKVEENAEAEENTEAEGEAKAEEATENAEEAKAE